MVKHTQTICWQKPTNCLSVFDHFVGLMLKGLKDSYLEKKILYRIEDNLVVAHLLSIKESKFTMSFT